jgi:hypothetical protein
LKEIAWGKLTCMVFSKPFKGSPLSRKCKKWYEKGHVINMLNLEDLITYVYASSCFRRLENFCSECTM